MGRTFAEIDADLATWIETQPLFFVSTAPNDPQGHVNVSPKGGAGLFRVLGPTTFGYVDLVGSGAETIAHLRENGRIVAMFCAFHGAPKIIRLHGTGAVHELGSPGFDRLFQQIDPPADLQPLARSIIVIEVTRIADSCGFMVPRMEVKAERRQLVKWSEHQAERHGEGWKDRYVMANNVLSIDGLPAIDSREVADAAELKALSSDGKAL